MLNDFLNMSHDELAQRALELSQRVVQLEKAQTDKRQTFSIPDQVAYAIVDMITFVMRRGTVTEVVKLMSRHQSVISDADQIVKRLSEVKHRL